MSVQTALGNRFVRHVTLGRGAKGNKRALEPSARNALRCHDGTGSRRRSECLQRLLVACAAAPAASMSAR